jgi:NAD+ kinase
MKVAIMINALKPHAKAALIGLCDALKRQNIEVLLEQVAADLIGVGDGMTPNELAMNADLIAVLGGDGTMLSSLAKLDATEKPVAGINIGNLGFLTSCKDDEFDFFAESLVSGQYGTSERSLLKSVIRHADGGTAEFTALNEIVLARGQTGRLISLQVMINGELLNHYRADGLIVATPTGSTAYSLSAGGPLVAPDANLFVVTPICPHSLSYRSLVVNDNAIIEIIPDGLIEEPMFFTVDGRDILPIGSGARITVSKSDKTFHLVNFSNRSFYEALRQKLGWRG